MNIHTDLRHTVRAPLRGPLLGELGALVRRELADADVLGCSVAVVDPERLVWSGGFGLASVADDREAQADTVYRLFSGTKLFTAVAVLQLAEAGVLSLEEPVATYLPDVEGLGDITLLHLLSHRSGLRDTLRGFLAVTFPGEPPLTTAEALARYRIRAARLPGTRVEYRNVNYALLGEVVTRASGLEYDAYVRQQTLTPLGMGSNFALTAETRPRAATGYIHLRDPMRLVLPFVLDGPVSRLYGARPRSMPRLIALNEYDLGSAAVGGLVGTVEDFGVFLRAQLSGGGGVLSPASAQRMQALAAEGAAGVESRVGVGLGWKVGRVGARRFLNHEGGGAGFTSELRLYPDERLGIALAMNGMRMPATMRVAHRICEAVYASRGALGMA